MFILYQTGLSISPDHGLHCADKRMVFGNSTNKFGRKQSDGSGNSKLEKKCGGSRSLILGNTANTSSVVIHDKNGAIRIFSN